MDDNSSREGREAPAPQGTGSEVELHSSQPQPTLEDLIRVAGPLAQAYFTSQERHQERDIEFDTKALEAEVRQSRLVTFGVFTFATLFLALAAALLFTGHEETAIQLIQLVVGIGGAALGGYGYAVARRASASDD